MSYGMQVLHVDLNLFCDKYLKYIGEEMAKS